MMRRTQRRKTIYSVVENADNDGKGVVDGLLKTLRTGDAFARPFGNG